MVQGFIFFIIKGKKKINEKKKKGKKKINEKKKCKKKK
jgi:hypothetical protein